MFVSIITYGIADTVGYVILQPALLYSQYFIESVGDMETYGIHLFVYHILFYFFFRQPTFVRKSVLQFISVELCFLGTEDRRNFRKFDFSDAGKVVRYLFLLVLDLLGIGKNLPFATATYAIMLAKWDSSFTRIFVELHCLKEA